ncbi:MAG: hypothetical protein IT158_09905 [Bryobacterales bacterium]|nr:hypothetical protein [Bryobacterales bacterium]
MAGNRLAALLLIPAVSLCAAPREGVLRVDLDGAVQRDFLGVNGVYHGFAFMPEQAARGMTEADRVREFDRVRRMGLHIARTWYRPDWAYGASFARPFDWESQKMRAFYQWLAAMKEAGVDVALQAAWWFPRDMHHGFDSPRPERDLPRYAEWVSESLHQLIEVRGFANIRYLVLFTEPTQSKAGPLPWGETLWQYCARTVKAVHHRLAADGRRQLVKLIAPNNGADARNLKEAVADLNGVIDIYSGHTYNKAGYEGWLSFSRGMSDVVAGTGKPLWLDEYGRSDEAYRATGDYGTHIAEIVAASMNAGHQTSMIWLLFDQLYVAPLDRAGPRDSFHDGVHRWGTCKWPGDTIAEPRLPYPSWYALSLLSRRLGGRAGTHTLKTEGGSGLAAAATRSGEDVSVLVINTAPERRRFRVALSAPLKRPMHRYLYDPVQIQPAEDARLIPRDRRIGKPGSGWKDELPGRGFAVY